MQAEKKNQTSQNKGCLQDYHYAILALIFLSAFAIKIYFATREPLIHNLDAGYYVKQIHDVLTSGFPTTTSDPPFAFYYAAAFSLFFGIMDGFKIAICLASAGIAFPIFKITKYLGKNSEVALLSALLAAFSPVNEFMMGDLLKNQIGLFFGAWFVYFVIKTTDRFSMRDAALAFASALLMAGSHLSSTAYIGFSMLPFLVLFPAYKYWKEQKIGSESLFCAAIACGILLAGLVIFLTRGWDIGVPEQFANEMNPAFSLSVISKYLVFALPVALGLFVLWRGGTGRLLLFIPWLAMLVVISQPFMSQAWAGRFEWDAYWLVAILSGLGVLALENSRLVYYAAIAVLALYTLNSFFGMIGSTGPIITLEEWQGLLRLHEEHPDVVFTRIGGGGLGYWVEAAGFRLEPDKGNFVLACVKPQKPDESWMGMGCSQAVPLMPDQIGGLTNKAVARFGRFYVFHANDVPMQMR